MNFITRYCRIKDYKIVLGDQILYDQPSSDIDAFLNGAIKGLSVSYPKFYKMDRLSKLGFLAAEILMREYNPVAKYGPQGVSIILANAHASLDTDIKYFETTRTIASPALFVYTLTNIVIGEICIRHGIKGENAFFVSNRFDAELLANYVDSIMITQKTFACIAGWVDVLGNDHDVFLYLAEKTRETQSSEHTSDHLNELYLG
ncbi:MAG: hypothetical protein ABJA70_06615 [Chryseolinea sp.]